MANNTMKEWSNLAKVVYRRTYSRVENNVYEDWVDTVERVIKGNVKNCNVSEKEIERLRYFMLNRKAIPAGRGLWYSGTASHSRLGGVALNNCWFTTTESWTNFVLAQDLLMLGGGVGMSVEHRFTSKLPKVKKDVMIIHKPTKDADFIVADSREGWCELTYRVLESFFVTGRSFSYSTVCLRGRGEPIAGFGGTASGPFPFIAFIDKIQLILNNRQGKHIRPIDGADIICSIGEMVVAGNVRRSAIILLGDPWDKEYMQAKRWDLSVIPAQRAMANWSVVCDDVDDLHSLFWKTYEFGEPFGLVNRKNIQKFGRIGELKKDSAIGVNPCAEATLEDGEPCNLQEIALPRISNEKEFEESARLMHRYGKRVTLEKYHHSKCDEVVKRNRRIGTGITGCLQSPLFNQNTLNNVYQSIQEENTKYSKELGIPESIRTTVIKPSGTVSKILDVKGEGIHPAYSKFYIQRIRFSATDLLIPILKEAGHNMEPTINLDGTLDHNTLVVDFCEKAAEGLPTAEEYDTWKQLESLQIAQKYWADQSVSVTIYYKKEEVPKIRQWVAENLKYLKTISFLCHNDHGFKQAPKQSISQELYEEMYKKIRPISIDQIAGGKDLDLGECDNGACPIK